MNLPDLGVAPRHPSTSYYRMKRSHWITWYELIKIGYPKNSPKNITSSLPLKIGHPKKETTIPTIHFQVQTISCSTSHYTGWLIEIQSLIMVDYHPPYITGQDFIPLLETLFLPAPILEISSLKPRYFRSCIWAITIYRLPKTNIAPENRPFQKDTIVFQPSIFRCYHKNIRQNGNLPQVGVKIKNLWNHHIDSDYNNL